MKKFINKILNVPKLILTIWIMLWVILIILLIMKFCFGIWYPIVVDNKTFMNVCNFIDENKVTNIIVMLLFYILNSYLMFFILTGTKYYKKWYLYLITCSIFVGMFFLKTIHNAIGMASEITMVLVAIIINCKTNRFGSKLVNILMPIIFYIIINLWQFTMLVVRQVDDLVISNLPSLIYLILQIDYYIFLIISLMGVSYMGLLGWGWFWSKDVTILEAEKAKELAKENPDMEKVDEINARIVELEKEGK